MNYSQAVDQYGTKSAAARALGITRNALVWRMNREQAGAAVPPPAQTDHRLTFPDLPDPREPIDKLIRRRTEHYLRNKVYKEAAKWQQVHVNDTQPIGLALMGDPHLDDDGCNWPQLVEDVELIAATPGMYGVNAGDFSNNWVGRLTRLFGHQETSQTSARQLTEWLLLKAGVRWAACILGNHDEWNEGGEIIRRMAALSTVHIPVHDWQAKLEFVFPNGATCRMNCSHDFKGRSIYSTTHGALREAIWSQSEGAHLLVAGHIHFGGLQQVELPGGHNPWLVRVAGYKEFDRHALVNGFHEGQRFRSAVAIVDPNAPEEDRVAVFGSVAQGARVLSGLRAARASVAVRSKAPAKRGRGKTAPKRKGGRAKKSAPRRQSRK